MKEITKRHLEKAFLNERFFMNHEADWMKEDDENLGWAAIILFYAAVHYVDALMEELGDYTKPTFHRDKTDRNRKIIEKGRISRAKEELITVDNENKTVLGGQQYKQLFDMSMDARYDPVKSNYFSKYNLETAKGIINLIRTIVCIRLGFEPICDKKSENGVNIKTCSRKGLQETLCSMNK